MYIRERDLLECAAPYMIQGCHPPSPPSIWSTPSPLWTPWLLWSCRAGSGSYAVLVSSAPPPVDCGCFGPVVLIILLPCEMLPVLLSSPRYRQQAGLFPTLRHRGAGSPYTGTLSIEHHALVVGHVTALADIQSFTLWYLCCAGDSPPPMVLWFWWSCPCGSGGILRGCG